MNPLGTVIPSRMLTAASERETDDQLEGSAISLHRLKSAG